MDTSRRKGLQAAVAALCVEVGYTSANRDAIETLTQILLSCKDFVKNFVLVNNYPDTSAQHCIIIINFLQT